MKRYALADLISWKTSEYCKPLVLNGARQVGKTWLMKHFGENYFENTAYIDFFNNERMKRLFSGDLNIDRLIEGIQVEAREKISPKSTLIIFDEVQEVPLALSSLKYFYENAPEYAIIAGGSLLGVQIHKGTSFPVGKVNFANLYPMSFFEFLEGIGEEKLALLLQNADREMIPVFSSRIIDLLRIYFYVGGMPECVSIYSETHDYEVTREVQRSILAAYERDFSKHIPAALLPKVRLIWETTLRQLSRENKNFSPGVIRKGSRMKDFEDAMQWLLDAGLLHKIERVNNPAIPLSHYTDGPFKLYMLDIGLLSCMAELDAKILLEGSTVFKEFKGALTENYVCQELIATGKKPYYWSSEGTAEVDFLFKHNDDILPLEVKAEENLQSKSLKVYSKKYNPKVALRTSMRDYREDGWLTNIPLYCISSY